MYSMAYVLARVFFATNRKACVGYNFNFNNKILKNHLTFNATGTTFVSGHVVQTVLGEDMTTY